MPMNRPASGSGRPGEGRRQRRVAAVVHVIGYLACLREPRVFDLWLTKVSRCPRVRNFAKWRCNSYHP